MDGRVAVVTGGASGIGRAIAEMFAAHGARMHIVDLNEQAAEPVKEGIHDRGGSAKIHGCDVSVRQIELSMIESVEEFGAELQIHPFLDHRVFQQSHIPVVESRAGEETSPRIT